MDSIIETSGSKNSFFSHVFSSSEESKSEILNTVQYGLLAIIPIVCLNKLIIQKFLPEASDEKSSIEIGIEIIIQMVIMLVGLILIHRIITYIPTYSGFKYSELILTSSLLTFLLILLSIQTKIGIKVSILADRVSNLWNGESSGDDSRQQRRSRQSSSGIQPARHVPSQADSMQMDDGMGRGFPPMPLSSSTASQVYSPAPMMDSGPVAANSLLGSSFGSLF
jgi:hypothetical protein